MRTIRQAEAFLDLPQGVLTQDMLMEVRGDREVILEGACDIVEYGEDCVRLRARGREIRLNGTRLTIDVFGTGGTAVTGHLLSIEFL